MTDRNRIHRWTRKAAGWTLAGLIIGFVAVQPTPGVARADVPTQGLNVQKDIKYSDIGGALLMDEYAPQEGGPFPAIVGAHGGGWVTGTRDWIAVQCANFAQAGYACFTIDYHFLPTYQYPDQVDEMAAAVKFVRDNASRFNIDPQRIAAFGTSAGATLALSVAEQYGIGSQGSQVACVVSWSAGLDFTNILEEAPNTKPIQKWVPVYAGVPTGTDPQSASAQQYLQDASPYFKLKSGDPPMFIANARQEFIPFAQGTEFVAKLKDLGIPYEFLTPPSGHAVHYTNLAMQPSIAFYDKYLKTFDPGQQPSPAETTIQPSAGPSHRSPRHRFRGTRAGGRQNSGTSLWPVAIIILVILGFVSVLLYLRWRRSSHGTWRDRL